MNLLVTGAWRQAVDYIPRLTKMGFSVKFLQCEKDDLPCDPTWVEGIIGNGVFLWHPIEEFTNLRYVQLTSAGFDRVPMVYASSHRIKVNHARGVYSIPMAEMAVAGVLQLYKGMKKFADNQSNKKWEKIRNLRELAGKTITIVGCGSVGTECAKRFKAFDTSIIGVDVVFQNNGYYESMKSISELNEALRCSDVVVVTLPLTDETKGLFNAERLGTMKDDAVLVNISRGAVVETNALISELRSGRLSAVLDVFEGEPLREDDELWIFENVIITPHNSFVGEGNNWRLSDLILKNLESFDA